MDLPSKLEDVQPDNYLYPMLQAMTELAERYAGKPWLWSVRLDSDDGGPHIEINVNSEIYTREDDKDVPRKYKDFWVCVLMRPTPRPKN